MIKLVRSIDKIPFSRKREKKLLRYNYIYLQIRKKSYTFYYLTNGLPWYIFLSGFYIYSLQELGTIVPRTVLEEFRVTFHIVVGLCLTSI